MIAGGSRSRSYIASKYERAPWFRPLLVDLLLTAALPVLAGGGWSSVVPVPHPVRQRERGTTRPNSWPDHLPGPSEYPSDRSRPPHERDTDPDPPVRSNVRSMSPERFNHPERRPGRFDHRSGRRPDHWSHHQRRRFRSQTKRGGTYCVWSVIVPSSANRRWLEARQVPSVLPAPSGTTRLPKV